MPPLERQLQGRHGHIDRAHDSTDRSDNQVFIDDLQMEICIHLNQEAEADRRRDAYPTCICCGHSVFRCETYRVVGERYICGDCDSISELGFTEDLEV